MSKIFTVIMPDIGEGVVEGEVVEWLKKPNDALRQDEPVVVVMTDKATVELPAPYPGKLAKIYYAVGESAIKGKPLYDIELDQAIGVDLQKPLPSNANQHVSNQHQKICIEEAANKQKPSTGNSQHVLAAPHTRQLANKLGVNIDSISGTGPEGRILDEDIKAYLSEKRQAIDTYDTPITALPGDEEVPLRGIRNLMAKKMAESKAKIPHFSYFEQVEATRLIQLRKSFRQQAMNEGISLTYMPFLIKALSLSLLRFPFVNSSVDSAKNAIIVHHQHNIGIAITTSNGLIVPVLKSVELMSLNDVIRAYDLLKEKAFSSKLLACDMKDSTMTISNFGVLGGKGLWATPIINYPETAILAVAKIHQDAVVRNSEIVARNVLNLSWSFDHRVIDGEMAAAFSHYFSTLLQNPAPLL